MEEESQKVDYSQMGYDRFLRRNFNVPPEVTEDAAQIETPQIPQSTVSGDVPKEKIQDALGDLVHITSTTTAGPASVGNNEGVRLTSTLSDPKNPIRVLLGICEITAYQTTLGSGNAIIPYGSNTIAGNYKVHTSYDIHQNTLLTEGAGRKISYTMHIQNQSGSTQTIIWYVRWRYIGEKTAS